jgi:hypothetical protein
MSSWILVVSFVPIAALYAIWIYSYLTGGTKTDKSRQLRAAAAAEAGEVAAAVERSAPQSAAGARIKKSLLGAAEGVMKHVPLANILTATTTTSDVEAPATHRDGDDDRDRGGDRDGGDTDLRHSHIDHQYAMSKIDSVENDYSSVSGVNPLWQPVTSAESTKAATGKEDIRRSQHSEHKEGSQHIEVEFEVEVGNVARRQGEQVQTQRTQPPSSQLPLSAHATPAQGPVPAAAADDDVPF